MATARRGIAPDESTPEPGEAARVAKHAARGPRHPLRTAFIIVLAVIVLVLGSAAIYTKYKLSNVTRSPDLLPTTSRTLPDMVNGPVTFLVLGSDKRRPDDPQYDASDASARSDTMMLVYIPNDRQHVYVLSLTRDMWVPIHGGDWAKLNAAFDLGGAPTTVLTVEDTLNVPIQHVATIDFPGFVQLMDLVGGVDINNEIASEGDNGYVYPAGPIHLQGDYGLYYVRERKNLPNGDLDRTARQRLVVQAIIGKLIQKSKSGPSALNTTITEVSKTITVDDTITDSYILGLAASMKLDSGADVRPLMVPIAGYQTSLDGQAANVVDWEQLYELSQALKYDRMDQYYERHKDDPHEPTQNYDPSIPLPYGPATRVTLTPGPTTTTTSANGSTRRSPTATPTVRRS